MRKRFLIVCLMSLPGIARAQKPRPAATAPVPLDTPAPGVPITLPPAPEISDPMLTAVPPAQHVLSSWAEAISTLRARSTDLRQAVDQVLIAEAQTRTALAAYLPQINGTGALTHNLITTTVTPQSGTLTGNVQVPALNGNPAFTAPFSANLPAGGSYTVPTPTYVTGNLVLQQALINVQSFDQISISELNENVQRLSVESEKRILALSVANQIVAVVTAERSAEINRVGLRVALEQVAIASRKRDLGAATGLDVVRAQQNAANARATLVTGDETLHETREALGLALGLPEEIGISHDVNINAYAEGALGSCRVVNTVDERPDIAQARANLDVAKRNLRNVYFQFLPVLSAQSNVGTTGQPLNDFPSTTWNIQAILQVPIWDGGARYGTLRNARALEDIAASQLEGLRRQAIIQVEQAERQLIVAQESYRVADEQRNLAAQNDLMTQSAYMTGQGTSLELVTASEAHRQAELNLALQEFGVVKARILAVIALATCPW